MGAHPAQRPWALELIPQRHEMPFPAGPGMSQVPGQPPQTPSAPGFSPKLNPLQARELSDTPGTGRAALAWQEQQLLRGPAVDTNQKAGNLMATPMPPHPGNDRGANTGHEHRRRALGKGEACGMLNCSGHAPAQKSRTRTPAKGPPDPQHPPAFPSSTIPAPGEPGLQPHPGGRS